MVAAAMRLAFQAPKAALARPLSAGATAGTARGREIHACGPQRARRRPLSVLKATPAAAMPTQRPPHPRALLSSQPAQPTTRLLTATLTAR